MRVALFTVSSKPGCTLKDVAGGFGTTFAIGSDPFARILEWIKSALIRLPPPVLGYLAALAKQHGYGTQVHELQGQRSVYLHKPPECEVAIVLSSITDAPSERQLLAELQGHGIPSIVIGAFATAQPGYYAPYAGTIVRGEPESLGSFLFDTKPRGVIEAGEVADLDALPFPDWSTFARHRYRYAGLAPAGAVLPVLGMRGCAYRCMYCPYPVTASFRVRKASGIIAEVRHLKEQYGARAVAFRDPLFGASRSRLIQLTTDLQPLGVRYSAEMRADQLDESTLDALCQSGLRSWQVGVESVDANLLDALQRRAPHVEHSRRIVAYAERLGNRVIANYILGLPQDSHATMQRTIAFAQELNTFAVQFTLATPYPGTGLSSSETNEKLESPGTQWGGFEPVIKHPELTAEALRQLRRNAYVGYHYRMRYALHAMAMMGKAFTAAPPPIASHTPTAIHPSKDCRNMVDRNVYPGSSG